MRGLSRLPIHMPFFCLFFLGSSYSDMCSWQNLGVASIHSCGPCAPGLLILREALRSASIAPLREGEKVSGTWPLMTPIAKNGSHIQFILFSYITTKSIIEKIVPKSISNLVIQKSLWKENSMICTSKSTMVLLLKIVFPHTYHGRCLLQQKNPSHFKSHPEPLQVQQAIRPTLRAYVGGNSQTIPLRLKLALASDKIAQSPGEILAWLCTRVSARCCALGGYNNSDQACWGISSKEPQKQWPQTKHIDFLKNDEQADDI